MSEVVATLLARNEAYVPQHATRPPSSSPVRTREKYRHADY